MPRLRHLPGPGASLRRACGLASLLLVLHAPTAQAQCDCSTLPSLGDALDYPVLGLTGTDVTLRDVVYLDNGSISASAGVSGLFSTLEVEGNASIEGVVAQGLGTLVDCSPLLSCATKILGGILPTNLSAPIADALSAASALAGMAPTQSLGSLDASTTLLGNGCINVIEVSGGIDLDGDEKVTLSGSVADVFVLNVAGNFNTADTADLVLDGIDPSQVIVNMVTPGASVNLDGDSGGHFTVLNPLGDIISSGNASARGAFIAGGNQLVIEGAIRLLPDPFQCSVDRCPEPDTAGANPQQAATPPSRSTGNTSFFYAWSDADDREGHLEHFRLDAGGVVKDEQGNDAIDASTHEFVAGRDPYWDAALPLRSDVSRALYTTLSNARDDLADATESDLNLSAGELSAYPGPPASTADLRTALLAWMRGEDAFDADGDSLTSELRTAVLGSMLRTRPLFVGTPTSVLRYEPSYEAFYQAHDQRERAVYVAANDGLLHGFAAGDWYAPSSSAAFDAGDGAELFGYAPGSMLPWLKLLPRTHDADGRETAPPLSGGQLGAADAWLGDGSGSDIDKSADEWATVLIAAFRDYGRSYLALDVTEPGAGAGAHAPYPRYLWEFADARMGETWSRPVITRVKLAGSAGTGDHCGRNDGDGDCREQWVAIFGAGYSPAGDPNHPDYEADPASVGWRDESKALFMVELDSGDILAQVSFDATGSAGPAEMKFALASRPAVLDLDGDRFADLVLIGDLGGQMWKWDLSAKGIDSDADPEIDNWAAGVLFEAGFANLSGGDTHHRSFFDPPTAAFVNGQLHYAFASGERAELVYTGDAAADDNNRLYVMRDPDPTGAAAIPATPYSEADLTDITALGVDNDASDLGFFTVAAEGEKFVGEVVVFAGNALVASFVPEAFPACGPGQARLNGLGLATGAGLFDDNGTPEAADRTLLLGSGVPNTPMVSVAPNPDDDVGFIHTSDGKVFIFEPPDRSPPASDMLYWRQDF